MNQILSKTLSKIGIEIDKGTLIEIPNGAIIATTILSISAISQWAVDLVFEMLSFIELIPKIPFRINFISLTFLSALLAYQTFIGLEKKNLRITRNALQVSLFVEIALVIGDLLFLRNNPENIFLIWFRLPFIILTFINVLLVMFISFSLRKSNVEKKPDETKTTQQ